MRLLLSVTAGIFGALSLAACTTPNDAEREARLQERLAMADEAGLVCSYEQIMGSLRRERVCRSPDEIARAREEAFRETDRIQRATPGPR
ncbi:hypothetical protein E5163_00255 [Marinicauda algicola]|uniref:Lipoprotein n=1 Tax=Marinicauda algicola TaxID=2029849 RepID=A0A4S2H272_9PROT|nr:hypothetical protein [Marinicauda algicola]TGY89614.1 hypothetical protein E5163_00255 [Marinicauda algicola]